MRGKFVLVLTAAGAAAAGWSLVRRAADDPTAGPGARGDVTLDPAADSSPARPAQPEPAETPSAAPEDPEVVARAWFASGGPVLREASARARALQTADAILARAESLPTDEATRARMLARRLFGSVYDADTSSKTERDTAYDRSRALFDVLVRGNGAPAELVLRHRIEPGQNVWALAKGPWKQAGATVAPGFVLWVNGISDARKVRAGQTLKVPLERLSILVRKRTFELTAFLGGSPVERFPIAIGADSKTPVGRFEASDCLKDPDWYVDGRRIPFGSAGHIIGTRWIGLRGAPEVAGIGIHGTTDEASIGTTASLGCVRLRNADVERVFEWIAAGTAVEIRD